MVLRAERQLTCEAEVVEGTLKLLSFAGFRDFVLHGPLFLRFGREHGGSFSLCFIGGWRRADLKT